VEEAFSDYVHFTKKNLLLFLFLQINRYFTVLGVEQEEMLYILSAKLRI